MYIVFYILFWPDTWRIVTGVVAAWLLAPRIMPADSGVFDAVMMYIMLASIGYAVSAAPARRITAMLKKLILHAGPQKDLLTGSKKRRP